MTGLTSTARRADRLDTVVTSSVTATSYRPSLARPTLLTTSVAAVAPGIGTPLNRHWKRVSPVPEAMATRNVAWLVVNP